MTLGYLAGFSETLARAIILKQGIAPLKDALVSETEDHIRGAAAWSLGQIGACLCAATPCLSQRSLLAAGFACGLLGRTFCSSPRGLHSSRKASS